MDDADQRAALLALVGERGERLSRLSATILGRNAAYLSQYLHRGSPRRLPERERALLCRYFGKPEAFLGGPVMPEVVEVPRLDVAASAGPGGWVDGEAALGARRIEAGWLQALGVRRAGAVSAIRIRGDSMAPTLSDGDEILVDTDDRAIRDDRVLVVRIDGELLAKRLAPAGTAVRVISDNSAYPERRCPIEAVEVVGRVLWLGRRV